MSLKCDVCGDAAMTSVLKDPFGKSDAVGNFCAVHAPSFSALRTLTPGTDRNLSSNEHTTVCAAEWEKAKAAMTGEKPVNTNNPIDRLLAELDEDAADCKHSTASLSGRAAATIRLLVKSIRDSHETRESCVHPLGALFHHGFVSGKLHDYRCNLCNTVVNIPGLDSRIWAAARIDFQNATAQKAGDQHG